MSSWLIGLAQTNGADVRSWQQARVQYCFGPDWALNISFTAASLVGVFDPGIAISRAPRRMTPLKTITTALLAFVLLAPSMAEASHYRHHHYHHHHHHH